MNKPTELMNRPTKPITTDQQRGIGVVELLFAASAISAAILFAATSGPKLPPTMGD